MIIGRHDHRGQQRQLRRLFFDPRPLYPLSEAARLLGVPASRLRREVRAGARDASKLHGAWRFSWRQMVCMALERWTLSDIESALGADASKVLPRLLTLRSVTVRLPEYVLRALETIAQDRGTTLDHCLYGELMDFASTAALTVAARIPGYRRAYLFPAEEADRVRDLGTVDMERVPRSA